MYSNKLRNSLIWKTCVPSLASPEPLGLNLREFEIPTHDISIPICAPKPTVYQPVNNASTSSAATIRPNTTETLHIILLTASAVQPDTSLTQALARVERLLHRTGGVNIALVFLLQPDKTEQIFSNATSFAEKPIHAYMTLQSALLTHPQLSRLTIPVLPLYSTTSLVHVLRTHVCALSRRLNRQDPGCHATRQSLDWNKLLPKPFDLLQHCTSTAPHLLLSLHPCYVITDTAKSLADVSRDIARVIGALNSVVEDKDVRGFEEFWTEELILE